MSKPSFVYVTYIATTAEKVWRALTDTDVTRRYWVGLTAGSPSWENVSDWKAGHPLPRSTTAPSAPAGGAR